MQQQAPAKSYYKFLWERFHRNPVSRWALRGLYLLIFFAVFADFIANEKPLYCKIDGQHYFPVLKQYAVRLGWSQWESRFITEGWHKQPYQSVLFPPIPYSATFQDIYNRSAVGPFDHQKVKSWRWRHWLGTDMLGRDVAAGMVSGARVAVLVGIVAMSIATLLGLFFGSLAGFFGDSGYKLPFIRLLFLLVGAFAGFFYGFISRAFILEAAGKDGQLFFQLGISVCIIAAFIFVAYLLSRLFEKIAFFKKRIAFPFDLLVMRLIEIMRSIPTLLLLLAVVAIIRKPSILYIMAIIGLIRWTSIAQFLRAELLKIRQLEYIEATRALGFGNWRIIVNHALPNAITPVLITISFGVASSVLLEAFMSFLGIGVAAEEVTWGALLNNARQNFSAWWLAVFPGMAIFFTVVIFNLIGEGLTEAMEVRLD